MYSVMLAMFVLLRVRGTAWCCAIDHGSTRTSSVDVTDRDNGSLTADGWRALRRVEIDRRYEIASVCADFEFAAELRTCTSVIQERAGNIRALGTEKSKSQQPGISVLP